MTGRRGAVVASLALAGLLVVPAAAAAADTYADASRPDDSGDCLTPATACKTIGAAVTKAAPSGTVRVLPGTYVENVILPGGIALVADSGTPTIAPTTGVAIDVTGGPAATIDGLTISSNVASQPAIRLRDAAGSMVVSDNTLVDPTPTNDNQVGLRTTAQGTPQITGNTLTGLWRGIEVQPPVNGNPGIPLISGNTINGVHDIGDGIQIVGAGSGSTVTGPTTANVVGNLIRNPGAGQQTGVFVLDPGSFSMDPTAPTTGVAMSQNRIIGGTYGVQDAGARGAVTLDGDVIARTGSPITGGAAILLNDVFGFGGEMAVTNVDVVNQGNLGAEIGGIAHLTVDSSIFTSSILVDPPGTATCTISFSRGPTTGGGSCASFQTSATPSFVDEATDDYHLTAGGNTAFIDMGNPVAPPPGTTDPDGDPRAIDSDGACPLNLVRDIGADEFNPGVLPDCPVPPPASAPGSLGPTGQRAAAIRKCKRKFKQNPVKRKKCLKRAKRLPA